MRTRRPGIGAGVTRKTTHCRGQQKEAAALRNLKFTGIVVVLALGLVHNSAQAQNIGVVEATLEDQPLCQTTMDDVTTTLGRPSGVKPPLPLLTDFVGPTVSYHPLGISFEFLPETGEPGSVLASGLTVYLVRTWDEDSTEWFEIFTGEMDVEATGDWRIDRTLAELASHNLIHRTPEIQREALEEVGILAPGQPFDFKDIVSLQAPEHRVDFDHEPIARFLEQITILCN